MKEFYQFIQHCVEDIDKLIFEKFNLSVLSLLCFIYVIFIYGLGRVPANPLYRISQNPFVNIFPGDPKGFYLYDSILIPFISYFTGLNQNQTLFLVFNFFIVVLAIFLLLFWTRKEYGQDAAKLSLFLLLLSPVSTVLFTWLGYYDFATLLLQVCLLFSTYLLSFFLIGFLGSMNHFPIMLFSGMTFLLFKEYSQKNTNHKRMGKKIITYLLGLGLGYFFLKMYQDYSDLGITVDRLNYSKLIDVGEFAQYIFKNALTWLFSFYNILWIVVLFIGHYLLYNNKKLFYIFLGSNFLYLGLTMTVIDSTRVFSLLSFPLLLYSLLYVQNHLKNQDKMSYLSFRQFCSAVITLGLFIPRLIIWKGEIYFSVSWAFMSRLLYLIRSVF